MKTKEKMLKLMEYGLKPKTLSDLSESQINSLYLRLLETKKENNEAVPVKAMKYTENELKAYKGSDGSYTIPMGENEQLEEKFESKKQQKYFYSKCGDGKTKEQKKWCKMAKEFSDKTNFKKLPEKKKETKEGSNYQKIVTNAAAKAIQGNLGKTLSPQFESKLEKQITKLLEDNMSPKMSKRDFLKLIYEMDSPGIKEKEPDTKPKPVTEPKPDIDIDPFGIPDPFELPSPEAESPGTKEKEPDTKPKPVTEPKPDIDIDPFGIPDPFELPSPEAEEKGFSIFMRQVINKGMLK